MPTPTALNRYFVSPWLDFFLVGGGSLVTYAALSLISWDGQAFQVAAAAGYLSWVVNWPHFSATIQRLTASPRSHREFPLTVKAIPVIILVAVVASLNSPEWIAPYFIKLYLLWSPFHFSGQTVGVTLIYARRNEITFSEWGRRCLSLFVFGTFAASILQFETSPLGAVFYHIPYPGLGVSPWLATAAYWVTALAGLGVLVHFARACRQAGRVPVMVLVPALSQGVWFIVGSGNPAFYVLVPFFHSLQYLPIVWAMTMAEKKEDGGVTVSTFRKETFYWYLGNVAGGIALFHMLPQIFIYAGVAPATSTGVLLAGIQLHHFFVDGVVWKLKSTRVNAALTKNLPLLMRTV